MSIVCLRADVLGGSSAATNEQSQGIGQVSQAVTELGRMAQQNTALVEESTAAAEQLKEPWFQGM